MAGPEATLTLTRVRATSYRVHGELRFLVELRGTDPYGETFEGLGDARPRKDRTAGAWTYIVECVQRLEQRELPTAPAAAVAAIQQIATELAQHASLVAAAEAKRHRAPFVSRLRSATPRRVTRRLLRSVRASASRTIPTAPRSRTAPFHHTRLAVVAALVDLVEQVLGHPLTDQLGPLGPEVTAAMPRNSTEPADYDEIYAQVLSRVTDSVAFPHTPPPAYQGIKAQVYDEVPYLRPLGSNGTKGHLLEREALRLGLSTTRFSKGAFVASDGVHPPLTFKWSRSPRSSAVSLALCTHKEATRLRLGRAGLPVPRGRTFANGDYDAAREFVNRIGYPVVVKPAMGVRGIGVVAGIRNEDDLQSAFDQLASSRLGGGDFIVEQHVTGRDYRIIVIGDEVIAAILREPASVEGDGEHTIGQLIVNKNTARRLNPHLWGRPIKYGDAAQFQLRRAGLSLASVPAPGEQVLLSNSCSLSQGGDSIDVLDELHPSIKEACVAAVKAVPGLWFCGIDFLIEDHTRPLGEQSAGICELNAHAAIGNCEYPLYGQPRQVARTVIEQCVDHYGLAVWDKPAEQLALRLTIRGRVTRVGYRTWLQRHAEEFGLRGWVGNVDDQTVEAVLIGDVAPASALAAAAVLGPKRAYPTSVTTEHLDAVPDVTGFHIRLLRKLKE